ncbi:TIGR00366 family protein [Moraxella sp. FZLJ2107]|uniref:TIGR00366 family protein n=1 Tax=unclassified Moraxella TaxID=2685852 RepID=UPI0020C874CC|nr:MULTISPECIES: TIGR00366 family protein [unclassified Moraxella]UTO05489.1 TIGR00366 family protein [Moraxella sp. FZLJ2107]UTO22225.1 TIGR00366 family protein [Moraxella sp. FZLJ2109]
MFQAITNLSVKLVKSYLPSPFVFCIILTVAVFAAAMILTGQSIFTAAKFWGDGLWSLLGFSMQMALILVTGHVLAKAPIVGRFLDNIAAKVKSPKQAIVAVTKRLSPCLHF